ncbi:MAG: hypothetical protein QOI20_509 [Acidimicrobiaceae bacterium]|nr:hypothetical protein [Acidimicrobiaceae bacterium]
MPQARPAEQQKRSPWGYKDPPLLRWLFVLYLMSVASLSVVVWVLIIPLDISFAVRLVGSLVWNAGIGMGATLLRKSFQAGSG